MVELNKITRFLNKTLHIQEFQDYSQNGLQVYSDIKRDIKKIYLSVDATAECFEKAKNGLLIVHHGLFWNKPIIIDPVLRKRIEILIKNNTDLYAVHLPLDANETYGNNAELIRLLGTQITGKIDVGFTSEFKEPKSTDEIKEKIKKIFNTKPRIFNYKNTVKRFVVISGNGSSIIPLLENIDLLITGEIVHPMNIVAKEKNLTVICAGHYNTETLGVKAIGQKLKELFNIETEFIDCQNEL